MVGPWEMETVLTIAGVADGVGLPAFSAMANRNKERTATCTNLLFKKLLISKPSYSNSNVFRIPRRVSARPCWLYPYPKAHDLAQVVNKYVPTDGIY
jgi:hypothetical protein